MRVEITKAHAEAGRLRPYEDAGLHRVRRGAYVRTEEWAVAGVELKHLAHVEAVRLQRNDPLFAMESALLLWGIPAGLRLDDAYTTGDLTTPGHRDGVRHSHRVVAERHQVVRGGHRVCTVPYALAEFARRRPRREAVAAIDHALRMRLTTKSEILDALGVFGKRTRAPAQWAVAFADGRSESVLESYSRVTIHDLGFIPPELQVSIPNVRRIPATVDFEWPEALIAGEADGAVKYREIALAAGVDPRQVVIDEKLREDAIRESHRVARWMWGDVMQPARLDAILRAVGVPKRHGLS